MVENLHRSAGRQRDDFDADSAALGEAERAVSEARMALRVAEAVLRRKTRAFEAKHFTTSEFSKMPVKY